jgi:hypothetical protein
MNERRGGTMKKLLLGIALAAIASFSIPLSASAAEYETFVGCDDLAANPIPSHVCQVGDFPGAFFAADTDTNVELCVEFPTKEFFCTEEEFAEAGILYVNSIISEAPGNYFATWFVEGVEIGSWAFRLDSPPPPPPAPAAPTAPAPPAPPPPAVLPSPSPQCLKAKQRVSTLKNRLRTASARKLKVKLRGKLKGARATAKRAC